MNGDFELGDWAVHPTLNAVTRNDVSRHLSPKAVEVLVFLAGRQGDVASKEDIFAAVWPGIFVTDDALTRCIGELRRVFEDDAREPNVIQTIAKRGYRLVPPVRWLRNGAAGGHSGGAEPVQESANGTCISASGSRNSRGRGGGHAGGRDRADRRGRRERANGCVPSRFAARRARSRVTRADRRCRRGDRGDGPVAPGARFEPRRLDHRSGAWLRARQPQHPYRHPDADGDGDLERRQVPGLLREAGRHGRATSLPPALLRLPCDADCGHRRGGGAISFARRPTRRVRGGPTAEVGVARRRAGDRARFSGRCPVRCELGIRRLHRVFIRLRHWLVQGALRGRNG